jgi:hypothetical protein
VPQATVSRQWRCCVAEVPLDDNFPLSLKGSAGSWFYQRQG